MVFWGRDDLVIINWESNGENIFSVVDEVVGGGVGGEVLELEFIVLVFGEGELVIRWKYDVFDEVGVVCEVVMGDIIDFVFFGEVLEDDGFVFWSCDYYIVVVDGSGYGCYYVSVCFYGVVELELFFYGWLIWFWLLGWKGREKMDREGEGEGEWEGG